MNCVGILTIKNPPVASAHQKLQIRTVDCEYPDLKWAHNNFLARLHRSLALVSSSLAASLLPLVPLWPERELISYSIINVQLYSATQNDAQQTHRHSWTPSALPPGPSLYLHGHNSVSPIHF